MSRWTGKWTTESPGWEKGRIMMKRISMLLTAMLLLLGLFACGKKACAGAFPNAHCR